LEGIAGRAEMKESLNHSTEEGLKGGLIKAKINQVTIHIYFETEINFLK
jgi:hypothetical protein